MTTMLDRALKNLASSLLALLTFSSPVFAALVVESTTTLDQQAAADPIVFNHTCPAGSNLIVVGFHLSSTDAGPVVTYNGDSLTQEVTDNCGSNCQSWIFYRVNPDIGTNLEVSIDLAVANDGGAFAICFSGANTSTPLSGSVTNGTQTGTSTSLNVTCAAGNIALDTGGSNTVEATNMGADQTQIMLQDDGSGDNWASREAGAGTNTMSWSWTNSRSFSHAATCVNARQPLPPAIIIE